MSSNSKLQRAASHTTETSVLNLLLCSALYSVCNHLFEPHLKDYEFASFINLGNIGKAVEVAEEKKRHVCHMIYQVSNFISVYTNYDTVKYWRAGFLKACGIPETSYKTCYRYFQREFDDFCKDEMCSLSEDKIEYIKNLNKALEYIRQQVPYVGYRQPTF